MKDVNFGLGTELADTDQKEPAIAMHGSNVLATWGQGDKLRYRLGKAVSSTVAWSPDGPLTDGVQSSCALVHNSEGQAGNLFGALVYKSDSNADQLSARAGRAEGRTITWGDATSFGKGQFPALAVNDGLYAVVAFRESDPSFVLRYRVGFLSIVRGERGITFADDAAGTLLGTGDRPAVAINGARQAIFVWQTNTNPPHLNYRVGTVANNHISGLGPVVAGPVGRDPSVALAEDGTAILTYRDQNNGLLQLVGRLGHPPIFPSSAPEVQFDRGRRVSVATHSGAAIQIHQSPDEDRLSYSTSLLIDRASWMKDHLPAIGGRTLRQLTLPASHDAGMYEIVSNDPTGAAQTQDLSLFDQLSHGIRYFDLRPQWDKNGLSFNIYHDIFGEGDAIGPPLADVLADVKRFMEAQREVVILKFSKYSLFDTAASKNGDPAFGESDGAVRSRKRYDRLVIEILEALTPFLYFKPAAQRLADISLSDLLKDRNGRGIVLVVADGDLPLTSNTLGIYVYRDDGAAAITTAGFDSQGDLRVFDKFFEGTGDHYDGLRGDQKSKFDGYRGGDDLFLLSWTATPLPVRGPAGKSVKDVSQTTNRNLATGIAEFGRNGHGQIVNLVFVNYGEEARVTDVCLHYGGVVPVLPGT